jgi:hypothetical protein
MLAVEGVATPERMANSVAMLQLDLAPGGWHCGTNPATTPARAASRVAACAASCGRRRCTYFAT